MWRKQEMAFSVTGAEDNCTTMAEQKNNKIQLCSFKVERIRGDVLRVVAVLLSALNRAVSPPETGI